MIEEIIKFYRQKYNLPILYATKPWHIDHWNHAGILIGLPTEAEPKKKIQGMTVLYDRILADHISGEELKLGRTMIARVDKDILVLAFNPVCDKSKEYVRNMLDEAIPKMARFIRMKQLKEFTNLMTGVNNTIKATKQSSIDHKQWEINELSRKMQLLYEEMATDRMMLQFYSQSEDELKSKVVRMYLELNKLVPGLYSSFQFQDKSIIGVTNDIHIVWEYYDYHFHPFTVTFHLETGHIKITSENNYAGDYMHPHVSEREVCWGNIGSSIARLSGQMELYGLFQLIHEFLSTYNEVDPFQRIEHWNPNWEDEDDDQPYCEYCDSTGHEVSDCEYCWWCEDCLQYHDVDDEVCPATVPEEVANEQAA